MEDAFRNRMDEISNQKRALEVEEEQIRKYLNMIDPRIDVRKPIAEQKVLSTSPIPVIDFHLDRKVTSLSQGSRVSATTAEAYKKREMPPEEQDKIKQFEKLMETKPTEQIYYTEQKTAEIPSQECYDELHQPIQQPQTSMDGFQKQQPQRQPTYPNYQQLPIQQPQAPQPQTIPAQQQQYQQMPPYQSQYQPFDAPDQLPPLASDEISQRKSKWRIIAVILAIMVFVLLAIQFKAWTWFGL
jgi:hypothetical protein